MAYKNLKIRNNLERDDIKRNACARIPMRNGRHAVISVPSDLTEHEARKLKEIVDLLVNSPDIPEYRIDGVII